MRLGSMKIDDNHKNLNGVGEEKNGTGSPLNYKRSGPGPRAGPRRATARTTDGLFEPLLLPIRHLSVDSLCYPELCRERLIKNRSLFIPRGDDVIVMTYPRSGTTWTLEITRQIHLSHQPDIPAEHPLTSPNHKISAPWINNHNNMVGRNLDSDPSPRVMKSHNHYRHINLLPSDSRTKIIHVMRDPRDVLCSMYHHVLQVGALFDFQGTFTEFVQHFLAGRVESGSYWEFNLEFLLNPNKHNILYLTYEELTTEKTRSIRKINRFLGYQNLSEEQVDQIDQRTKFEVMKPEGHSTSPTGEGAGGSRAGV